MRRWRSTGRPDQLRETQLQHNPHPTQLKPTKPRSYLTSTDIVWPFSLVGQITKGGRRSYADILRMCLPMSRRTLTLWNGGRYEYSLHPGRILILTTHRTTVPHTLPCAALPLTTLHAKPHLSPASGSFLAVVKSRRSGVHSWGPRGSRSCKF